MHYTCKGFIIRVLSQIISMSTIRVKGPAEHFSEHKVCSEKGFCWHDEKPGRALPFWVTPCTLAG